MIWLAYIEFYSTLIKTDFFFFNNKISSQNTDCKMEQPYQNDTLFPGGEATLWDSHLHILQSSPSAVVLQ